MKTMYYCILSCIVILFVVYVIFERNNDKSLKRLRIRYNKLVRSMAKAEKTGNLSRMIRLKQDMIVVKSKIQKITKVII